MELLNIIQYTSQTKLIVLLNNMYIRRLIDENFIKQTNDICIFVFKIDSINIELLCSLYIIQKFKKLNERTDEIQIVINNQTMSNYIKKNNILNVINNNESNKLLYTDYYKNDKIKFELLFDMLLSCINLLPNQIVFNNKININ